MKSSCCFLPAFLCLALVGSPAAAQQTPEPDSSGSAPPAAIEEIVVTAQKRDQRLQETPISMAAFTGEVLEAGKIEDVSDLQFRVPGLVTAQG